MSTGVCSIYIQVYLQVHCPFGQAHELPQLQVQPGSERTSIGLQEWGKKNEQERNMEEWYG